MKAVMDEKEELIQKENEYREMLLSAMPASAKAKMESMKNEDLIVQFYKSWDRYILLRGECIKRGICGAKAETAIQYYKRGLYDNA